MSDSQSQLKTYKPRKWHLAFQFQFGTLERNEYIRPWRVWFYRHDSASSGGIGFRAPILHLGFTWWWGRADV